MKKSAVADKAIAALKLIRRRKKSFGFGAIGVLIVHALMSLPITIIIEVSNTPLVKIIV